VKKAAPRKAAAKRARARKTAARRPAARQPRAAAGGRGTVTPYLVISNAAKAIEFYKKAFGAEELYRMPARDGNRLMHATIRVGESSVMMSDEFPEQSANRGPDIVGSTTVTIHMEVPDVDKAFARAVEAGATVIMPVADMFWGDRFGKLRDPFGHEWSLSTHKRDLSPAEIQKAAADFFAKR
jgi:uncharacterized glyoxalase superfamily protein PhnB